MSDDIYRIVYTYGGYSRRDESKLYQGGEIRQMLTDLLEWELENRAFPEARPYSSEAKLNESLSERWRKWLTGKPREQVKDKPHKREIRLEKHTTEGWVLVDYDVTEPAIVLHEAIQA